MRVSGLGASAVAGVAADDEDDTAEATVIGPGLSAVPALNCTLPVVSRPLMSLSAQLRALVSTKPCAMRPLTPPGTGVTERASGKAVRNLNRWVMACEG